MREALGSIPSVSTLMCRMSASSPGVCDFACVCVPADVQYSAEKCVLLTCISVAVAAHTVSRKLLPTKALSVMAARDAASLPAFQHAKFAPKHVLDLVARPCVGRVTWCLAN